MGQRLCLNLTIGNETICNTYYHWSAYTETALALVEELIASLEDTSALHVDPKIRAYMAFRQTGAQLTEEEHQYILNLNGSPHFNVLKTNAFEYHPDKINRSDGLIAFSPEGMSNTDSWAEGSASLDMEDLTFYFDVFHSEADDHDGRSELIDSYDMEDGDIDRVPVLHGRIDFENMYKEDIPFMEQIVHTAAANEYSLVHLPDMGIYFGVIQ